MAMLCKALRCKVQFFDAQCCIVLCCLVESRKALYGKVWYSFLKHKKHKP